MNSCCAIDLAAPLLPVHIEDGDLVPVAGPVLEGDYLRLPLLAGDLDDGGEVVGGGGDHPVPPPGGQQGGQVGRGDQQPAAPQLTRLADPLALRQVNGVRALPNLIQ